MTLLGHFNRNICTPASSCCYPVRLSCGSSWGHKIMQIQDRGSVPAHIKWQSGEKSVATFSVWYERANIQFLIPNIKKKLNKTVQCRYVKCLERSRLSTRFVIYSWTISALLCAVAARAGQPRWVTFIPGPSGPPKQQQWRSALPLWEQLTSQSHLHLRHLQKDQLSGVKQNPDHHFRTLQPRNTRPPSASTCVNISLFYGRPFFPHMYGSHVGWH